MRVIRKFVGGEIGWEWADGTTRVELNLYRSVIDGLQSRVELDGQANVFQSQNLGTSRSQGVELTVDLRLSRHWLVRGGYTLADAVITDDPNPDFIGNQIHEVPRHAGSVSVRYDGDRGTRAEVRARAVGQAFGDATNMAIQPAHQVVDLSFSRPIKSGLEGYVIVENVFDELYWLALTRSALRSGLPRTITVGVRLDSSLWRSSN